MLLKKEKDKVFLTLMRNKKSKTFPYKFVDLAKHLGISRISIYEVLNYDKTYPHVEEKIRKWLKEN